jgi:hypothetical protein
MLKTAGLSLTAFLMLCLLVACDPSPARQIGLMNSGEDVVVLFRLCKGDETGITRVVLWEMHGQRIGDKDDSLLWEVTSNGAADISSFTLGVAPIGFTTVVPLDALPRDDQKLALEIYTDSATYPAAAVTFKRENLRVGSIFHVGNKGRKLLTEEAFQEMNVCANR